jgi:hypothetical protein
LCGVAPSNFAKDWGFAGRSFLGIEDSWDAAHMVREAVKLKKP